MKLKPILLTAVSLALSACGPRTADQSATRTPEPANAGNTVAAPGNAVASGAANGADPDRPAPLSEPKGAIDPKSVEAAGQVVQHYGALIEQGHWTASRAFWGDAAAAQAFERNFRTYADVHLEIGDLGEAEGAAGSIYVTEPVTFYGKKNGGGAYRRAAIVTLRRVNDVDGSTEAQRRWHIERIEWK